MKRLFKSAHLYYFQVWLALVFTSLYPIIFYFSRSPAKFHGMNRVRWIFSYLSSLLSGFIFRFSYEEKIDWSKRYIICANHTSNLDITAIILLAKRNYVFLGKEELLDNFITGIYFRTIDIPLNRDSKISAFRAFKKAGESLKDGKNVVIFPEGMISENYPPVLQPFKNGPFKLAIEQGVQILPVTICNNWNLMWDDGKQYGTSPGICDICVHAPIDTANLSSADAEDLKSQVYGIISGQLNAHQNKQ
ncbi:1-acyl-sn-glycerol-3-phosphate acyltransferase [Daejeonella rubra]|uniref:1-acyl-sn-glycerol-3-phosphate acyltransferase n=1 Tax=Daejeonella rubra TaxID=990371 RepID=A0A1G9M369_9SPHI|nr:lysophospholipid acyltransferase family protein [Daejeonella rubra]SDL68722.1 1-acyl-sn-glycerol-3-phosphate acyltransferase [Daejeonella rubra]